MPININEIYKS